VALGVAPAARADDVIATVDEGYLGSLSAYGGSLIWTGNPDEFAAARSVFVWDGAGVRTMSALSLPAGYVIRGADIGPDSRGGLAVVYAGCIDEGEGTGACSLLRVGLGGGRPRRVRGASSNRYDERGPSIWGSKVVFVRAPYEGYTHLYRVPKPLRGVFAAPLGIRLAGLPQCCRGGVRDSWITATDLRRRVVAYLAWQLTERGSIQRTVTKLIVKRFDRRGRGRSCVVAHARSGTNYGGGGPGAALSAPRLDGRYVYWLRAFSPGDYTTQQSIRRRLLPTRSCRPRGPEQRKAPLPSPSPGLGGANFAVDGDRIYYAIPAYEQPDSADMKTTIYETPATGFTDR